MFRNRSIITVYFVSIILLLIVQGVFMSYFWIGEEYRHSNANLESVKQEFLESKKIMLQKKVDDVIKFIMLNRYQMEQYLKDDLKSNVHRAHLIASHMYYYYENRHDVFTIQELIKETLRPMGYKGGGGYFFAISADGRLQLYPLQPELEGRNIVDISSITNDIIHNDELIKIKNMDEIYLEDDDSNISFIKYFAPLDWYLGIIVDLNEIETKWQQEVLKQVNELKVYDGGYIFVVDFDGNMLIHGIQDGLVGQNLWELSDPNGVKIIQEMWDACQHPKGGFIEYAWRKPHSPYPTPKLSYVRSVPDWNWMIATGIYLDDLEKMVFFEKKSLKENIKKHILFIAYLILISITIFLLIIYYFSRRVRKDILLLTNFFEESAVSYQTIDVQSLPFVEFKTIGDSVNKMIKDRQRIEHEMAARETKYRTLFSQANDAIMLMNQDIFLDCNAKALEMFGCERDQIVGRSPDKFSPPLQPDQRNSTEKAMEKITAALNGEPQFFYWKHTRYNGVPFDAEVSLNQLEINGKTLLQAIVRDITNRKNMERQLTKERMTLNNIIDLNPYAIQIINTDGYPIRSNQALFHLFGSIPPPEYCIFDDSTLEGTGFVEGFMKAKAGETVILPEFWYNAHRVYDYVPDVEVCIKGILFPITYSEEKVELIVLMLENVTRQKRAEEDKDRLLQELEEKNKELEQIIYVASHDLRSPLVNIQGFSVELEELHLELCDILEKRHILLTDNLATILKEDFPEALRYIQLSSRKIDSLLSGLLKLSRLGRAALTIRKLNMNQIIRDVVNAFEFQIKENDVTIEMGDLPECYGDETQINQVFSNLLENALKFLSPDRDGMIWITGERQNNNIVYCVADNGVGISSEYHQVIFEIFHRLHPELTRGEGLGLSIVKKILDRHHGRIWVVSELNKGSQFFILLPGELK